MVRSTPRCQRTHIWASTLAAIAFILSITIPLLGFWAIPSVSLDMRNLKLADRSVITATTPYDQYDFYFAHICKINDYVAGLDGQAADRKCVSHFSITKSFLRPDFQFGSDLSKEGQEHLKWLCNYICSSLLSNINDIFFCSIMAILMDLMTLQLFPNASSVHFSRYGDGHGLQCMALMILQGTIQALFVTQVLYTWVPAGDRFRCTPEICISIHRSWFLFSLYAIRCVANYMAAIAFAKSLLYPPEEPDSAEAADIRATSTTTANGTYGTM